jgi:hypothetical protein
MWLHIVKQLVESNVMKVCCRYGEPKPLLQQTSFLSDRHYSLVEMEPADTFRTHTTQTDIHLLYN